MAMTKFLKNYYPKVVMWKYTMLLCNGSEGLERMDVKQKIRIENYLQ